MGRCGFRSILRLFIVLLFFALLYICPTDTRAAQTGTSGFSFHVLDVGQGLSILMETDGHYLLYDGGGRDTSDYVVSFLQKAGVSALDYMVASHYDEDHLSGLVGALHRYPCRTVICPDYETDTKIYESFMEALQQSGAQMIHPKEGDSFSFGTEETGRSDETGAGSPGSGVSFQVVTPDSLETGDDNDQSVGIRVAFTKDGSEKGSFLVCGDAGWTSETYMEFAREEGLITLDSDIYVAGHHGSGGSSSVDFLSEVTPSWSVISCGAGNPFGHPHAEALRRLRDCGSKLFRTDLQGGIDGRVDDNGVSFEQQPSDDWSPGTTGYNSSAAEKAAGTGTAQDSAAAAGDGITYVCNQNTMKFHYPDCPSVEQIKPENRVDSAQTRDVLIDEGYAPCGWCQP